MKSDIMSDQDSREPVQLPDGGWGWVVVFASFLANLVTNGIAYSLGIFYFEFLEFYQSGKGETAWLGSLVPGLTLLFGILAGPLVDKFGCRITTVVGAIIAATGFVISVFAPNLYFLYFSFGVIPGLGFGLIYLPAIVSVGHYFERKRTFAVGLATSGSGIGAFIFNPFTKFLIDMYGWRGAILIQAGIVLNCAIFGALFRPLQPLVATKDNKERAFMENFEEPHENFPFQLETDYFEKSQIVQSEASEFRNTYTTVKYNDQGKEKKIAKKEKHNCWKENIPRKKVCYRDHHAHMTFSVNQLCDIARLKNSVFILYVVSNILSSLGLIIPLIFLYDYAVEQNVSQDRAKWLGSIIGITNTFGRGICGLVADRPKVNKLVLFSVALVVNGVATTLYSSCSSFALLVAFSCVFGLSYGWLFDATRSYNLSFLVAGVTVAISGIILILTPLMHKCHKQKNCQLNGNGKS